MAKLVSWSTLTAIQKVRRNLDLHDQVTFIFKKLDDQEPLQLTLVMQNAQECVNMIIGHLKKQGISVKKDYEKKRKILESEVNDQVVRDLKINTLLERIEDYETKIKDKLGEFTRLDLETLI